MIIISLIVYLLNLISFSFLIRFGNMIVVIIQILSFIGLLIYYLMKTKRKYIKWKFILLLFLISIIQILLFFLFSKYGIVMFPSDIDGALNSIITIVLFCMLDITFIIILLASNLIKLILNKIKELDKKEGK